MMSNGPVCRQFRPDPVETWTWHGELSDQMREWLGEAFVDLDGDDLLVETTDKNIVAVRPGWFVCRTADGAIIVMSAGAATAQFIAVEETP